MTSPEVKTQSRQGHIGQITMTCVIFYENKVASTILTLSYSQP